MLSPTRQTTPWLMLNLAALVLCGTAVADTVAHPLKALKVALRGPDTSKPMVSDPPLQYLDDHREKNKLPVKQAG